MPFKISPVKAILLSKSKGSKALFIISSIFSISFRFFSKSVCENRVLKSIVSTFRGALSCFFSNKSISFISLTIELASLASFIS